MAADTVITAHNTSKDIISKDSTQRIIIRSSRIIPSNSQCTFNRVNLEQTTDVWQCVVQ